MSGIEHISTGGCCQQTRVQLRCESLLNLLILVLKHLKAVILAHRPPISIPRTNVSPALLDELISEMSTLASVYHKPAGTFIGLGRIGADSMQRREEYVFAPSKLPGSHPRSSVCQTTNSLRRRRSKRSPQVNKPKIFSISTTFLQINRLDWPLQKSPPPYLRLQTLLREPRQIRSMTLSPSSETLIPHNRHQQMRSVHRLRCKTNRSRTRSLGWDWAAQLLLPKSLRRHHNKRKRRKICWAFSRAVGVLFSIYHLFVCIVASLIQEFSERT